MNTIMSKYRWMKQHSGTLGSGPVVPLVDNCIVKPTYQQLVQQGLTLTYHCKFERRKNMGMIETVKGPIPSEKLGKTMMHEHCLVAQVDAYMKVDGDDPEYAEFLNSPLTPENRGRVLYNMHKHVDNMNLTDENLAIKEFGFYKKAGGDTIVDVTTPGIGRDPEALVRISDATGLNIVASTALYIEDSWPEKYKSMSKTEIADFFLDEIENGMDGTGIKPGYIGEIGMSDDWTANEVKGLRAGGIASNKSGLSLTVHQPIFKTYGERICDILEDEGCDLDRVVLSHCDPTIYDLDYHLSLLERGVRLQFDQFAMEFQCTYGPYVKRWLPRDIERVRHIKKLCDLGWEDKITVSHDMCFKCLYKTYGGPGLSHIIENMTDYFLFEGVTKEQLNKILVENPKTILERRMA